MNCFCKEVSENIEEEKWNPPMKVKINFVHYLYLQFLNKIRDCSVHEKNHFLAELVTFYLQSDQPIKAIIIVKNNILGSESYFSRVLRYRVYQKIKKYLKKSQYFLQTNKKFSGIFLYDLYANYLKSQIYGILGQKIMFWEELLCERPQVSKLEIFGKQAVNQMENLHFLVINKILPIEDETKNYDCTLLYSSFLILTTNFSDYADKLLKNINKSILEAYMIKNIKCLSGI